MNAPVISVALPVYNGADYLVTALDSILAQDYTDFELVVSDNCSTDRTPEILAEYAQRDARLRVSRSTEFLPQAANVNRAINLCHGEWIKVFCHDDLMRRDCLQQLHRATVEVKGQRVGVIGNGEGWLFANGYYYTLQPQTTPEVTHWTGRNFVSQLLSGHTLIGLPALTTAMVKREAWQGTHGFDGRFAHFDVFFWTCLLMEWDYAFVSGDLTTNRIHGAQVAVSARKSLKSVEDQRIFYHETLRILMPQLNLNWRGQLRVKIRPMGAGATIVAIEIMKKNFVDALKIFTHMPLSWWGLLPPLIVRSLQREYRRIAPIIKNVPIRMVYP
jgi:hypothetical protein